MNNITAHLLLSLTKLHLKIRRFIPCVAILLALMSSIQAPAIRAAELSSDHLRTAQNQGQLAQLLSPIALYPDSLLSHILIASTYPLEIVQASQWQQKNAQLHTESLIRSAENKGWDPSVIALLGFPNVLRQLNDDINWTQALGDAFLENETQVLSTIQSLRHLASEADSLSNMKNMQVTYIDKQIIIEPAQKEVIYVPVYDPRIIYGTWRWHRYPPIYWKHYQKNHRPIHYSGRWSWSPGIRINFNYYFGAFSWRQRQVVVTYPNRGHRYRTNRQIATSQGAQRWRHKAKHRHGVKYRSKAVHYRNQPKVIPYGKPSKSDKHHSYNANKKLPPVHKQHVKDNRPKIIKRHVRDEPQHKHQKFKYQPRPHQGIKQRQSQRGQVQRSHTSSIHGKNSAMGDKHRALRQEPRASHTHRARHPIRVKERD